MRMRLSIAAALAALAPAAPAAAAPPFRATLTGTGHAPKVNVNWWYEVRVTDAAGRPVPAKITTQIRDPFGGVHPVEFCASKKYVADHPIKGRFRDCVKFPPESRGFELTFQVVVKAQGGRRTLSYKVKAQ